MPPPQEIEIEDEVPPWIFDVPEIPASQMKRDKNENGLKYTEPLVVKRVYHLGRILSQVFDQWKLHYWTSGGTTLGAVRHGGLIPWDDDLDICITQDSEAKLIEEIAPDLLQNHQIEMVPANPFGYRLYHIQESTSLHTYGYPFCDVFLMSIHKNKVILADRSARAIWPKEKYRLQNIENPMKRKFGDFELFCPLEPEKYLTETYGPDWAEVGETQNYCHVTKEYQSVWTFDLASYQPAQPFN